MSQSPDVTQMLVQMGEGDKDAVDRLLPIVYDHLRRMAGRELQRERPDIP